VGPGRAGDPNRSLFDPPTLDEAELPRSGSTWGLSQVRDLIATFGSRGDVTARRKILLGVSDRLMLTKK